MESTTSLQESAYLVLSMLAEIFISLTLSQSTAAPIPSPTPSANSSTVLRVGTTERVPYSWQKSDGTWTGPAIELWDMIAKECDIQYKVTGYSESEMLAKLQDGSIDIAATGIQFTVVADQTMDFSMPFDAGGFSLVTHARGATLPREIIERVMTKDILIWLVFMAVSTILAGVAIRYIEWTGNSAKFDTKDHLINGLWWAVTTLSTVGYGDFVPKTRFGKLIASIWMVFSLVLVAIFTANIVATLTVGRLTPYFHSIRDMKKNEIAIVNRPSSHDVANKLNIQPQVFPDFESAFVALDENQVEGFLHPTNELRVLLTRRQDPNLVLLDSETVKGFVGFGISEALPQAFVRRMNSALIRIVEMPEWVEIAEKMNGK